jgi:hypothetical protein
MRRFGPNRLMDALIEALTIMRKYANPQFPTNCAHDVLWVDVNPGLVSPQDLARLKELYFTPDNDGLGFSSSYFGSC